MLNAVRKKSETGISEDTDGEWTFFQLRVEVDEPKMRQYNKMLRWIEEQRIARAAEQATTVHTTGSCDRPRTISGPASPSRRRRNQRCRSPLSPVLSAVCKKPSTRRRSVRHCKWDAPQPQSAGAAIAVLNSNAVEHRRSKHIPKLRVEENAPLRPFRPQRVSKNTYQTKPSATINTKLQSTGRSNCQKSMQHSASRIETTRSGRTRSGSLRGWVGVDRAILPLEA